MGRGGVRGRSGGGREDARFAPREDRAKLCGDSGVCAEVNVKVCVKGKREA